METFLTTIVGTELTSPERKSGSYVLKSYNDLLCMRFIQEYEFHNLEKFLPKYFRHIEEPTLLVRIFGAFEIFRNSRSEYVVVMENMFFGIEQWEIYDFKGTAHRRFSKPPQIAMDVNFLLDRNS